MFLKKSAYLQLSTLKFCCFLRLPIVARRAVHFIDEPSESVVESDEEEIPTEFAEVLSDDEYDEDG